jgi:glucokinase
MKENYSIGVDLGGTNLRIGAYCEGQEFLDSILLPTRLEKGRDQVVRDMSDAIHQLVGRYSATHKLLGVGIGSPGPLELPEGIIRNPPNLPGWDGFALRRAVEDSVGRPVRMESDANLAALAEWALGENAQKRVESLCMLTLGTGVGSGFILDGRIWHGVTGMGGKQVTRSSR